MGERRILVIGSQCEALNRLSFLPDTAQELYSVMTDPGRGACVAAIEGAGLLLDPTVQEAKSAIVTAYKRAAKDEATLRRLIHPQFTLVGIRSTGSVAVNLAQWIDAL